MLAGAVYGQNLESWQTEIEARLGEPVRILTWPNLEVDPEDWPLLQGHLQNAAFLQAVGQARGITLNLSVAGRQLPFVFLHPARMPGHEDARAAILGHELGHLWLMANGFAMPAFDGGPRACLAIHTGDIVQHELMRREMDRRGIAWREFAAWDYEQAWQAVKERPVGGAGNACTRAHRLSLMVDIRAGFPGEQAEWRHGYLRILGAQDPEAEALAIEIVEAMSSRLELEAASYRDFLATVVNAVQERFR